MLHKRNRFFGRNLILDFFSFIQQAELSGDSVLYNSPITVSSGPGIETLNRHSDRQTS